MRKCICLFGYAILILLWALISTPRAEAYESYHDPDQNDAGYCSSCHPGFIGGRSDTLHALHTGGSDPVTTNCNLCHTGSGRDNPLTMWSIGDADDGLGCAGCHGKDHGLRIEADHRGFPITGRQKNSAWGLRLHHANNGITECASCHLDGATNPPSADDGTPWPEDSLPDDPGNGVGPPHYYTRPEVGLGGSPVDPCTNEDSGNDGDILGLDNDGDNLYDAGNDPDCTDNTPPVAADDSYTTDEDVTLSVAAPGVLANDTDDDGDALTAVLDTDVTNGTLSLSADGSFTYDPDPDFNGSDSFTYKADDGTAESNIATVTITVQGCGDMWEPDNSAGQANTIFSGSPQVHSICPIGDEDWVKFTITEPSAVVLETSGPAGDTRMWLYNSGLGEIEYNDDGGASLWSLIDRECGIDELAPGTYYVQVDEFGDNNIIDPYTLSFILAPCTPPPTGCPGGALFCFDFVNFVDGIEICHVLPDKSVVAFWKNWDMGGATAPMLGGYSGKNVSPKLSWLAADPLANLDTFGFNLNVDNRTFDLFQHDTSGNLFQHQDNEPYTVTPGSCPFSPEKDGLPSALGQ